MSKSNALCLITLLRTAYEEFEAQFHVSAVDEKMSRRCIPRHYSVGWLAPEPIWTLFSEANQISIPRSSNLYLIIYTNWDIWF